MVGKECRAAQTSAVAELEREGERERERERERESEEEKRKKENKTEYPFSLFLSLLISLTLSTHAKCRQRSTDACAGYSRTFLPLSFSRIKSGRRMRTKEREVAAAEGECGAHRERQRD